MTRSEFYEKYGNVEVTFTRYYKYSFFYEGVTEEGYRVVAQYGGDSSEIYRCEVKSGETEILEALCAFRSTVYDKDGNEVDSFYDY